MLLFWLLFFTFLSSILSLFGGILLLWREKLAKRLTSQLVAFAAGTMLAVSFLDIIPELLRQCGDKIHTGQAIATQACILDFSAILAWVLLGILFFFLLERFLLWFHHHHEPHGGQPKGSLVYLITVGDALHNFVDGVALASAFLISIPLGMMTAFSIALHELPQEIGDFGVLLSLGLKKLEVFFWNFISALAAFLGAVGAFYFLHKFVSLTPLFLSFAAGSLIYIAASDLIPELHREYKKEGAFLQSMFLLLGVGVVWILGRFLSV